MNINVASFPVVDAEGYVFRGCYYFQFYNQCL